MGLLVLIPAYSHGSKTVRGGLSYHLLLQALAVHNAAKDSDSRVCVASTPPEDAPGLWERLRSAVPAEDIFTLEDEEAALVRLVERLLEQSDRLVVQAQGTRMLRALSHLRKKHFSRLRLVYTMHSFRNSGYKRIPYSLAILPLLRRYADYTIFLSPAAMNEFVGSGSLLRSGRAGHLPLILDEWGPWQRREPVPGELDGRFDAMLRSEGLFRLLHLGAFKPGKGQAWMTKALAPLLKRHPQVHLLLCGWGDEAIQQEVRRIAETQQVLPQVWVPGSVRRDLVPWLLRRCHVAMMPSYSETFSQVTVEAMAAGLPVVGTRRGVGDYLIMDYMTGFGVEYDDGPALVSAVERLAASPESARRMGQTASQIVRPLFQSSAIGNALLELYRSLFRADAQPV
jgi:glycosyltransferase involved in cell wall biosynthesis